MENQCVQLRLAGRSLCIVTMEIIFAIMVLGGIFVGIFLAWRKSPSHAERGSRTPTRPRKTVVDVARIRRKNLSMDWVLDRDDWVVLDVEATGYSEHSEIIEVAILDASGTVVVEQRVMPKGRIPRGATEVHGITRQMLKDCPRWPEIDATVRRHLAGKRVIAYNVEYEQRLLRQTAEKWGLPSIDILGHCAMLAYAEHRGILGRDGYKWHKLVDACKYEGIEISGAHSALTDAQNAYALVLKIATDEQARRGRESPPLQGVAAESRGMTSP